MKVSRAGSAGKGEEPVVIPLTLSSAQSSRGQPALRPQIKHSNFTPYLLFICNGNMWFPPAQHSHCSSVKPHFYCIVFHALCSCFIV